MEIGGALRWKNTLLKVTEEAARQRKWRGNSNLWLLTNILADPWLNHRLLLGDKSSRMNECYKGSCIGKPWNRISSKISRAYLSVQLSVTFLLLSQLASILSGPKDTSVISTLSKTDRLSADKTQFGVSSICLLQIGLTTSPQMFRRTLLRILFY